MGDYQKGAGGARHRLLTARSGSITPTPIVASFLPLHSNAGLVRSWIGDEKPAIEHFRKAIDLDTELNRPVSKSINETGIGNVHRLAGRTEEAVTWYEAALRSLSEVSDRDRESDANLELGLALIETGQPDAGLARVLKALLLTSVGNLREQDWKHDLYLGEAYRALHQFGKAESAFRKADSALGDRPPRRYSGRRSTGWGWCSANSAGQARLRRPSEQAIDAVERFRQQYLPEALKISMLASKSNPYEALVDLLTRPDGHAARPRTGPLQRSATRRRRSRVCSWNGWPLVRSAGRSQPRTELSWDEARLIDELRALTLRESATRDEASMPDELDRLEEELNDVWTRIEASGRDGAEYVSLRRGLPLTYDSIRDMLREDS